ncbi:MAG: hypothetical protein LBV45_06440 [Xanthomonadaceae bacterium]|jgi:hypothetical protein|nr:hypothetical protein [Xanthomonadaceae bacterium]
MQSLIPLPLQQLLRLLEAGDIDRAIDAGLMDYTPTAEDTPYNFPVLQTQQKLKAAWNARDRYRAHQARWAARRKLRTPLPLPLPVLDNRKVALPPEVATLVLRAKAKANESRKK